MALQKREKILAATTGGLLIVLAASYLFSGGSGTRSITQLRATRDALRTEKAEKEERAGWLTARAKRLAGLEKRSLPPNREVARSLYQNWLRKLVSEAKLSNAKVDSTEPQSVSGIYWRLRFTIRAHATMEQIARLLHSLYSADLLHQIRRLTAKPLEDSELRDLFLIIEALSLPGAAQTGTLSIAPSSSGRLAKVDDYIKQIARRKMEDAEEGKEARFAESGGLFAPFAPYRPPPPPRPPEPERPEPPGFDTLRHTYITGIVEGGGKPPEVWLNVRTTGKSMYLHPGETFEIGSVQGRIAAINRRSADIDIGGKRRRVHFEQSLRDGVELPD